jgi:hypothetical protein
MWSSRPSYRGSSRRSSASSDSVLGFSPKLARFDKIIGRNTFQRPKSEALDMLGKIIKLYQGKD